MKKLRIIIITILIVLSIVPIIIFYESISNFFFFGSGLNPKGELFKIIIQSLGGTVLILGAYYSLKTARLMQENNSLIEKGNIAERFKNAISMLNDDNQSISLAGIYALNNIAIDNNEYRAQVFQILVEYINSKTRNLSPWLDLSELERYSSQPKQVIETTLNLLFSKDNEIFKNYKAIFEDAKLYGSTFENLNFSRCTFRNVQMQNSSLKSIDFVKSKFFNSDFTLSDFSKSDFTGSKFWDNTKLRCCGFTSTKFTASFCQNVDFTCAQFTSAIFEGAIVNACIFDGVSFSFNEKGNFNGACFSGSCSIRGLSLSDGLIARGGKFGLGHYGTPFKLNMKSLIGKNGELKKNMKIEDFPKSEVAKLEQILKIPQTVKFWCHTLLQNKNGQQISTGWVCKDLGEFTTNDYKSLMKRYNKTIKNKLRSGLN